MQSTATQQILTPSGKILVKLKDDTYTNIDKRRGRNSLTDEGDEYTDRN